MSDHHDLIQLFEPAVEHRTLPPATEDDMYEALDHCGVRVNELYQELDERIELWRYQIGNPRAEPTVEHMAEMCKSILFDRYDNALANAIAHKLPV